MSPELKPRLELLRDRAMMHADARAFFAKRGVLEVDVPLLSERASVDTHIDLIQATCLGKPAFLHSSPEYGMKRLLAEGVGDIYQISHVFRDEEIGERHNPEFTMVEWYRCGFTFKQMIQETLDFIHLFLDISTPFETLTYTQAFMRYLGKFPQSIEARDHLFALEIEPQLKQTVIYDFPAEQAALAAVGKNGMAQRFEIFYQGIELANGYHELSDSSELESRFEKANHQREKLGKSSYPIDQLFLEALKRGIPDCCGVAVGFDRLMMLRRKAPTIDEAIVFPWENS